MFGTCDGTATVESLVHHLEASKASERHCMGAARVESLSNAASTTGRRLLFYVSFLSLHVSHCFVSMICLCNFADLDPHRASDESLRSGADASINS